MKTLSLAQILTVLTIVLGVVPLSRQPSYAGGATFLCDTRNGLPTTVARNERGDIRMIIWNSPEWTEAGYPPEKRCREVSSKFQTYYNNGTLDYITTGMMNDQLVVCVARVKDDPCTASLFNIKNGSKPSSTLLKIFRLRAQIGGPIYQSDDRIYINMNEYLRTAPLVE